MKNSNKQTSSQPPPLPGSDSRSGSAPPNPQQAAPPEILDNENDYQAVLSERDDLKDRWLRSQAELENFRKRTQKELEQNRLYQSLPLVRDLLPGLDNLQRAVDAADNSASLEELLRGVQMVVAQFQETLTRHAVRPIAATGQPFDPNLHEAIQHIPSNNHAPMTVIEEVERGYQLHDRVIRPTKVIVSAAPPEPAAPTEPAERDTIPFDHTDL